MNNLGILPPLTKQYILEHITEETIMAYYMGIPLTSEYFVGNSFKNPFRNDILNTCNYYYSPTDGKLRYRDFAGIYTDRLYNGDCIDAVANRHNIRSNTKEGFQLCLNIIASDFKLHKYSNREEVVNFERYLKNQTHLKKRTKVFKVVPRKLNRGDELYWTGRYGVPLENLRKFKVYPVQELYVENNEGNLVRTYYYKGREKAYAYYLGKEENIHLWKIYFPDKKNKNQPKTVTNKGTVQGFDTFVPCEVGVITKSYKDVIVLDTFGIQSICLSSESTSITDDEYFRFKSLCNYQISLLDYDKAGIRMANHLKRKYNIKPYMFTRGRYNQPDFGVKDFSDCAEAFGKEVTTNIITNIKKELISLGINL